MPPAENTDVQTEVDGLLSTAEFLDDDFRSRFGTATLTATEAAQLLGTYPKAVNAQFDSGEFAGFRIGEGGNRRFLASAMAMHLVRSGKSTAPLESIVRGKKFCTAEDIAKHKAKSSLTGSDVMEIVGVADKIVRGWCEAYVQDNADPRALKHESSGQRKKIQILDLIAFLRRMNVGPLADVLEAEQDPKDARQIIMMLGDKGEAKALRKELTPGKSPSTLTVLQSDALAVVRAVLDRVRCRCLAVTQSGLQHSDMGIHGLLEQTNSAAHPPDHSLYIGQTEYDILELPILTDRAEYSWGTAKDMSRPAEKIRELLQKQ